MTAMHPKRWLQRIFHRQPLSPSPIPQAAAETRRVADEYARVIADLRRVNDRREAKLR